MLFIFHLQVFVPTISILLPRSSGFTLDCYEIMTGKCMKDFKARATRSLVTMLSCFHIFPTIKLLSLQNPTIDIIKNFGMVTEYSCYMHFAAQYIHYLMC